MGASCSSEEIGAKVKNLGEGAAPASCSERALFPESVSSERSGHLEDS